MSSKRAGDPVGEHFGYLREMVAARGGAVVKTASYLELKIGLLVGPCIAVDLDERLDHFGQT